MQHKEAQVGRVRIGATESNRKQHGFLESGLLTRQHTAAEKHGALS